MQKEEDQDPFSKAIKDTPGSTEILSKKILINEQLETMDYRIAEILKSHEEDFLAAYLS